MKKEGYYSTGQFISIGHITKKTLRYYNEHNILNPSFIDEKGQHFYTDEDLAHLQQILFLKYLGFSLADIKQMSFYSNDNSLLSKSLHMQTYFLNERIEQLKRINEALVSANKMIEKGEKIDWGKMIEQVNSKEMEESIKKQYENSSNIEARISLHKLCSSNKESWFSWIYSKCKIKDNPKILELGCGDGSMWLENYDKLPKNIDITLSDISKGMLKDIDDKLKKDKRFSFKVIDAANIKLKDNTYDLVIANHVLFYIKDLDKALKEIYRVLKKDGLFVSSTYSSKHMKEVDELVKSFDSRIELSKDKLYEIYGKENGKEILSKYFKNIRWLEYKDELNIEDPSLLIKYILSCHGNQNRYIVDKFKDFKAFVSKKCKPCFKVSKDAGIFICKK